MLLPCYFFVTFMFSISLLKYLPIFTILFDQLSILDDIQEVAEKENATETLKLIDKKRKQVERKLYQKPPLVSE